MGPEIPPPMKGGRTAEKGQEKVLGMLLEVSADKRGRCEKDSEEKREARVRSPERFPDIVRRLGEKKKVQRQFAGL